MFEIININKERGIKNIFLMIVIGIRFNFGFINKLWFIKYILI